MLVNSITSRSNPIVKETARLISSAKARRESGRFVLEGVRLCADARMEKNIIIETLFYTSLVQARFPDELFLLEAAARRAFLISEDVARKLADTAGTQGVFCVCSRAGAEPHCLRPDGKYIALENLQDPANLGAVCRTAEALGIDGAILSGCCDVYSPKALRSSMGSLLRLPLRLVDSLPALLEPCRAEGMLLLAAVPDREAQSVTGLSMSGGVIALVGNEGAGLSPETQALCTHRVTIPMLGRAESLNASMAAGILMWEMVRGGR